MNPNITRTIPPDPSVPGLWWMQHTNGHWEAWVWLSTNGEWVEPGAHTSPEDAHAAGWRCIAPAVPPKIPSDAAEPQSTPS